MKWFKTEMVWWEKEDEIVKPRLKPHDIILCKDDSTIQKGKSIAKQTQVDRLIWKEFKTLDEVFVQEILQLMKRHNMNFYALSFIFGP